MSNLDPVFKGKLPPTNQQLQALRVPGGSAALLDKLQKEIKYDRVKILAAGVVTTDQNGLIKSTHWTAMGAVKAVNLPAHRIWVDADKDVQVVLRFKDLTIFEFPASSNMSAWLHRSDLNIRFFNKSDKTEMDWDTAQAKGIEELSVRMVIVPGNPREASMWITVIPLSMDDLTIKVGQPEMNNPAIPHITLALEEMEENAATTFSSGKAVTATLIQQEQPNMGLGMGTMAFIDCTTSDSVDQGLLDPAKYKEACLKFFRAVVMGAPTTAINFTTALAKFTDKTANTMRKAPVVYPDFKAPATAGCTFLPYPQQGHTQLGKYYSTSIKWLGPVEQKASIVVVPRRSQRGQIISVP